MKRALLVAAILTSCATPTGPGEQACAWTSVNHSGVLECHVDGPYLTPLEVLEPSRIDTSSHITL